MHSPRVYFNNIGSICTDNLRHGNGLSALLLLAHAAKSSAAKSIATKTRSLQSGLKSSMFIRRKEEEETLNILSIGALKNIAMPIPWITKSRQFRISLNVRRMKTHFQAHPITIY